MNVKHWHKDSMLPNGEAMGGIKWCCRQPHNREMVQMREDLSCTTCKVCFCRHFDVTLDPAVFSLKTV